MDRQYEFTNSEGGTVLLGRGTNTRVIEVTGLLDVPDKIGTAVQATDRDGGYQSGPDFYGIRRVQMTLAVDAESDEEAELKTDELQAVFGYGRTEGVLAFKRVGKVTRQLFCRAKRSTFPANWDMATGLARGVVEFEAVDPLVYSNELMSQIIFPVEDTIGRTYPRTYPMTYSAAGVGSSEVISNDGTVSTTPTFIITGPANNPIISHLGLDRYLELTFNILAGQYVEVDTLAHTIMLNGETNRRNYLSSRSRWFELPPGDNEIRFGAADVDEDTQLEVSWRHAWPSA